MEVGSVYVHDASVKPLVNSAFQQWFINLAEDFYKNIIEYDRWLLLLQGLGNTMVMTVGALMIGVVIGIIIAVTRSVWETNGAKMQPGVGKFLLRTLDGFFTVYTTVFRGTPMMVQLLLMTFVILKGIPYAMLVAIISFGLNSGAYVAEIFRGGILSIDKGQMEAGRSIGLTYAQTMWYIIAPQVIKNVLPTLANEFITLIKETSIAAYAGVMELTMAGNRIRGQTFSDFMPLIAVAVIYLVIVMVLTKLVGILERRLRQSDAR
ncbi:MAG: amino acid ABC transporter permease [Clostridia bacterium]|nr:amino acid ABC transporter permease [Clostridia bacterium]